MTRTHTFGPEQFWYIKLREHGSRGDKKKPAEAWGGFDIEFDENENVYSYEQTLEMDHTNFAIVGYQGHHTLVVIDVDCHAIDDFDPDALLRPTDGVPVVKSEKPGRDIPGFHLYTLLEEEVKVQGAHSFIDVKADLKGHVVSPWHNDQYSVVDDQDFESFPNVIELNRGFEYEGRNLVTTNAKYATEYGGDIELPDDPPEELPTCLRLSLEARMQIPRDGSHPNPWKVDSVAGRRLVAFGYNKSEAMGLLEEYPPQDSWDERETSYQLDQLYSKQLQPDNFDSLVQLGIADEDTHCECQFCGHKATYDAPDQTFDEYVDDVEDFTRIVQDMLFAGIARGGKSHDILDLATRMRGENQRVAYVCSMHSEGEEQKRKLQQKFKEPDVVHLTGQERARRDGVRITGESVPSNFRPQDNEEASQRDDVNAYQCLKREAGRADWVVTVPSLLDEIGDYDVIVMTEEAAFSRILAEAVTLIDAQRVNGYDRQIRSSLKDHEDQLEHSLDKIDDLDRVDAINNQIRSAAQIGIDICDYIEEEVPNSWEGFEEFREDFMEFVDDRMRDVVFDIDDFEAMYTRLDNNHNRVAQVLLAIMYYDGQMDTYSNDNKQQVHLCPDPRRVYKPIDRSTKIWTGGNDIYAMRRFHRTVHDRSIDEAFMPADHMPVVNDMKIIRYRGGDNANQQSRAMQNISEGIQESGRHISQLITTGNGSKASRLADRIKECTTPSTGDDIDSFNRYAETGFTKAIAENSRFSEGVDTPHFEMGVMYDGHFATPMLDYIEENEISVGVEPGRLKAGEKARAAQNSILRPSNVPGDSLDDIVGTGATPVVVPDRHVPDIVWQMLELQGIEIIEVYDVLDARQAIIDILEDDDLVIHDGDIRVKSEVPDQISAFDELRKSARGVDDGVAD